ncbi:hypothetical protein [Nocardioides alkalitolerans]|uniref:spermine/spermidine synthase domain-containing protein n=1 Tax=Nocardioides alkalitolerans TaxID=281714 RepID=UPI0004251D92|nr:hypothetical protein [Nocardioides alkalitolerans]
MDIPVEVARAVSPRGEVVLQSRPAADPTRAPSLELRVNGVFVMDTVETTSERLLAQAALEVVDTPGRVLVGGLGLGFTAREVLADPRVERLDVVEIEPALVAWMGDGTVPHGPALLADPRLAVVEADVAVALAEAPDASYDLVLLDVDNGPDNLVLDINAPLYAAPALSDVRRTLAPGGVVVVWSATRSPALEDALRSVFGDAEARAVAAPGHGRVGDYWLHLAHR